MGYTVIHKTIGGIFWWQCPDCQFRREWTTERGVTTGVAQHLRTKHAKRLTVEGLNEHKEV